MTEFNIDYFWNRESYTYQHEVSTLYERKDKLDNFNTVQKALGAPFFYAMGQDVQYFDILKEKVITAQTVTVSENQNKTRKLQSLLQEVKGESGPVSSEEDLSDDVQAIQKQINYQSQLKFLQMYFDAYMAPKVSDMEWRLGKTTGTVMSTDEVNTGQLSNGTMYTRSQFSFPFLRQYWDFNLLGNTLINIRSSLESLNNLKVSTTEMMTSFSEDDRAGFIAGNEELENYEQILECRNKIIDTYVTFENLYSIRELKESVYIGSESYIEELGDSIINKMETDLSDILMTEIQSYIESIIGIVTPHLEDPDFELYGSDAVSAINQRKDFYSAMFFPPYKISPESKINGKTNLMSDIYAHNPEAEFDLDNFFLKKDGFTYRDPGCKSISDYINYLQWVVEGSTGIVHTYLTEWDLSLYMQQNMIEMAVNGAPTKLYLNYRIRKDNPMSSTEFTSMASEEGNSISAGVYTDDRALVFNVAGSSVSKIDFDNNKPWRPSDHPLSVWWLPYLMGRDWNMKVFNINDYMYQKGLPYMDIYDTVNSEFAYDTAQLRDIFKNQDYLGAIMGNWPNFRMKYFHAFYTSPLDGHTAWDIKSYKDLQSVAGADFGKAAEAGKGLDYFIRSAKLEMLLNEGYYSTEQSIAGMGNSDQWLEQGMKGGDAKETASSMAKKQKAAAQEATKDIDLDQPFSGAQDKANVMLDSLNGKIDASSMTNFTGMNRFSPVIFGGPHGSDYNPNTIQAYFDVNNKFLRNIARIDPSQAKDKEKNPFRSNNIVDYYQGLNVLYGKGNKINHSPIKGLSCLVKGLTTYTIDYGNIEIERSAVWVPVKDVNNLPSTTTQGHEYSWFVENDQRLVNLDDKRIEKEELITKKYSYNPFMNNDILIGNIVKVVPGLSGYTVTYRQLYRRASYKEIALTPYKKYLIYDKPNLTWEIVQHKFESYTADIADGSEYWEEVDKTIEEYADNPARLKNELNVLNNKYKPLFMLKFFQDQSLGDDNTHDPEKDIVENIISKSPNNKPVKVFFLYGNTADRVNTGPECIFSATLSMGSYKDVQENFVETSSIFSKKTKKVKTGESYRIHEFIKVDMANSEIIADNLQVNGYSNKLVSGITNPMHLESAMSTKSHATDIDVHMLQKFKLTNADNSVVSFKATASTKAGIVTSIISRVVSGVESLLQKLGFIKKTAASSVEMDMNSMTSKITGLLTEEDDKEYNSENQVENWISTSFKRLSGEGIITQFKGINPDAENITIVGEENSTTLNYKNELSLPAGSNNIPFKNISFSSSTGPVDAGLGKALLNLYLRPLFIIDDDNDEEKVSYAYVSLDTPFRNFLSILLTQISYYKFVKSSIIGETPAEGLVNFDTLWKTLTTCVDKCVLKASGLNSLNQKVKPDRNHILYDYWMEQIINILYGSDLDRQQQKVNISSQLQLKIDTLQAAIDALHQICKKDAVEWTLNEVVAALNTMDAVKSVINVSLLEKFLFGYLRILYYYRFFFLAKRFNKENGTMWIMRALESVLEFIVPSAPSSGPPPSPSEMTKKEPVYNVAFIELQNTTADKQQAIIQNFALKPDRIKKVYVRVEWCTEEDYKRYQSFVSGETTVEYDEVVEIIHYDKKSKINVTRYAFKPIDGLYTLISSEYLDNQKNLKWNTMHPLDIQRTIFDYDTAQWNISWGDSADKTPILWDVFGEINVDNLLTYASESLDPDELVCLIEDGADFWTVSLPESVWPRAEGFKSKLKIKQYAAINSDLLQTEPSITIEGPMAFTIYPITQKQERPVPGVVTDNPIISAMLDKGLGGF
jgi:hypothetical protein